MKHSKKITLLLTLLVLGTWGTIGYRIHASLRAGDARDDAVRTVPESDIAFAKRRYVYSEVARDPFRYVVPKKIDTLKGRVSPKPRIAWTPPPFRLTGIMSTKKRKTITLEGPGGAVYFLGERDTLCGVKVLKIDEHGVTYRYQAKKGEWTLDHY